MRNRQKTCYMPRSSRVCLYLANLGKTHNMGGSGGNVGGEDGGSEQAWKVFHQNQGKKS